MNVSMKLDNEAMQTWAVYVDDTCIARGLPAAEASRIVSLKMPDDGSQRRS
jgi:hypothetical protein